MQGTGDRAGHSPGGVLGVAVLGPDSVYQGAQWGMGGTQGVHGSRGADAPAWCPPKTREPNPRLPASVSLRFPHSQRTAPPARKGHEEGKWVPRSQTGLQDEGDGEELREAGEAALHAAATGASTTSSVLSTHGCQARALEKRHGRGGGGRVGDRAAAVLQ